MENCSNITETLGKYIRNIYFLNIFWGDFFFVRKKKKYYYRFDQIKHLIMCVKNRPYVKE